MREKPVPEQAIFSEAHITLTTALEERVISGERGEGKYSDLLSHDFRDGVLGLGEGEFGEETVEAIGRGQEEVQGGTPGNVHQPPPDQIHAGHHEVLEGEAQFAFGEFPEDFDGVQGQGLEEEMIFLDAGDPVEVASPLPALVGENSLHEGHIARFVLTHTLPGVAGDFLHGTLAGQIEGAHFVEDALLGEKQMPQTPEGDL
jgi:hypothetical protein